MQRTAQSITSPMSSNEAEFAKKVLSPMAGRGDWIPDVFKHIFKNSGSTDLVTCCVFSKILYWFIPSRGGRKKFYGKSLRLSVTDISEQVCISYTQAKRALKLLECTYKFISRKNVGSITYINLDIDTVQNAIEAYQPSIADAELVYQPSIADEELVYQPSIADEDTFISSVEPVHIHKEDRIKNINRKGNSKMLSDFERDSLLSESDDLEARMQGLLFTEDDFFGACDIVRHMVESRVANGDTVESLLNFLLSSVLSSELYPAYARIFYMVRNIPEKFAEYPTEELVYQLRTECIGNLGLVTLMTKHCPTFDMDQFGFDLNKMYDDAFYSYNNLFLEHREIVKKLEL